MLTIDFVFDPWMSRLPDEKMLHQITIPGSHDSGTRGLDAVSECQSMTLEHQLRAGVRHFDIRLDASTTDPFDYRNRHGLSFIIQDLYSVENIGTSGKFALVKQYLEASRLGKSPESWFLNFASCTETLKHPKDYAAKVNPQIGKYFAKPPAARPGCGFGTILMDYVDPGLVSSVVAANFP